MKYMAIALVLSALLGACVSNTAYHEQQKRLHALERQSQVVSDQLEKMRNEQLSDRAVLVKYGLETEKLKTDFAAIDSLSKNINNVSTTMSKLGKDLAMVSTMAEDMRFVLNRISTLQEEFADNNKILMDIRKNFEEGERRRDRLASSRTPQTTTPRDEILRTNHSRLTNPEAMPPEPAVKPESRRESPRPAQPQSTVPQASSANEKRAYDSAKAAYDKRQFDQALRQFEDFIIQYPNSELIVNANYWIAE
ncbi:MAG: hypothetical protein U1C33_02600, partial [Candidatus Cloacimonadaceae bacterium]|nr:hypothetical protein [Candidatus Cloacimonadaceae bacterium]